MLKVTVRIEGGDKLAANLKKIGVDLAAARMAALFAAGEVIKSYADGDAPGPHNVVVEHARGSVPAVAVGPDKDHFYYKFLEYGTTPHRITPDTARALAIPDVGIFAGVQHGGHAQRPFLRPAVDNHADDAFGAAAAHLRTRLP